MKKIYLLGISALLAGTSVAQNTKMKATTGGQALKPHATSVNSRMGHQTPNHVNVAPYWTDDFSDATTWTMTHDVGTADWTVGMTSTQGQIGSSYGDFQSTTVANGFALFDSDFDCSGDQIASITTTNSIDLSMSSANVRLVFEEFYLRWYDSTVVYVSNDGGTNWTAFPLAINNNTPIEGGPSTLGPNPTTVAVDISSVAAQQANVKIRFTFISTQALFGPGAGCAYFWFVDDAKIEDIPPFDGALSQVILPDPSCGLTASEPVAFTILNNGTNAITNFPVMYAVGAMGTPVVETYTGTIAAGMSDTYTFTTMADLSAPQIDTVYGLIAVTGDGDTTNDFNGAITQHYAEVMIPYTTGFEATPASDLENWKVYDTDGSGFGWRLNQTGAYAHAPSTNALYVIEFDPADGTTLIPGVSDQWALSSCLNLTAGTNYRVKYWRRVPSAPAGCAGGIEIGLGTTQDPTAMTQTIKPWATITPGAYGKDSADFTVSASGVYYMGFRGQNQNASAKTAILLDDISIYEAPLIGVKEVAANNAIAIFPNPSNGVFTVKAVDNSSVAVYSILGETVYSSNLVKGNNTVDLSTVAAGTYIVKINSGNEVVTKRVVINK